MIYTGTDILKIGIRYTDGEIDYYELRDGEDHIELQDRVDAMEYAAFQAGLIDELQAVDQEGEILCTLSAQQFFVDRRGF